MVGPSPESESPPWAGRGGLSPRIRWFDHPWINHVPGCVLEGLSQRHASPRGSLADRRGELAIAGLRARLRRGAPFVLGVRAGWVWLPRRLLSALRLSVWWARSARPWLRLSDRRWGRGRPARARLAGRGRRLCRWSRAGRLGGGALLREQGPSPMFNGAFVSRAGEILSTVLGISPARKESCIEHGPCSRKRVPPPSRPARDHRQSRRSCSAS